MEVSVVSMSRLGGLSHVYVTTITTAVGESVPVYDIFPFLGSPQGSKSCKSVEKTKWGMGVPLSSSP